MASPLAVTPAVTTTSENLADQAYRRLRQSILELSIMPGALLTERNVSESLEIGKTPVREALRRLVQDGLVESRPKVGYSVLPIRLKDARELLELRLVIEPYATELATPHLDVDHLIELDEAAQAFYAEGEFTEFLRINQKFHLTIVRTAGNRRLTRVIEATLDESHRLYQIGLRLGQNTVHKHDLLLQAFQDRDPATASALSRASITMLRDSLITMLSDTTTVIAIPEPHEISSPTASGAHA